MITEEDITFEDRRPFHKIKMYKDLMSNFISINTRTEIHRFFTKSCTKNITFKITSWIHNHASNIKRKCYI